MKVTQIICPKCKSSLTSKAGIEEGTPIICPKCKNKFAVAAPKKDEDVDDDFEVVDEDEEVTPKKPASKSGVKPLAKRPVASDDDEEEETPRKPAAKQVSKPVAKPKQADEDEDDDEEETPRRPAAKSGLKPLAKRGRDDDDEDDRPKKGSKAFAALNRDNDDEDDKPARRKKGRDDDEDEDDSPRAKRKSRVVDDDDDDEDRPRRRRSRDDDEEGDDEPKSTYAKLKKNVYVRASVLGVLLVIMGVLAYILWDQKFRKKDDDSAKKDDDLSQPIVLDPRQPSGKPPTFPNPNDLGKKNDAAEQAKFQGTWNVTKASIGGVDAPPNELKKMTIVIRGDQAVMSEKVDDPATLKLNASTSPAQVDFIDNKNVVTRGIYRFADNNALELCINTGNNAPRPAAFATQKGSTYMLMRLQRAK